ncbi:unnamed protein product [Ectocarpus sp. 12 AP-2014]
MIYGTTLLKLLHHPHSASFRPHAVQNTRSWSNIAQAFTDKKRIRPASAPTTKREEHQTQPSVDAGSSRGRAETARARLADGTTRRDGPMSFQRAEEIQEVVDILQHTMVARLPGKPKKGERKKAAEAAKRAGSAPGTSVVDRRSHGYAPRVASPRGSVSATSSRGDDADRRRSASGAGGEQRRRRRRPSTAWHHRELPARCPPAIPAGMAHGSKARPKTAAVMASSFSKSKRSLAEDLESLRRPSGLIGDDSHKADADGKLGMTRARIYSFGASTQGGGGHEEDMLRATAIDAARRSRLPRRCSSAGSAPRDLRLAVPGRRETGKDWVRDDEDGGGGSAAGGSGGVKGRHGNASCRAGVGSVHEDSTDSSEHLGVVDISKEDDLSWLFLSSFSRQLTTVLSHAEVSGYIRTTGGKHSSFTSGSKLDGGGGGASMSAIRGSPLLADGIANRGTSPSALLDNEGGSGNDEEAPTVPETSSWSGSSSAAKSDSGSNDDDTRQRESAEGSGSDTRTETRGRSDRGREVGTKTIPGTAETEGVMPTGSTPPQLDCLRGRYARADRKSKSAYAIKKAAAVTAAGIAGASTTAPQTPHAFISATRCDKRGLFYRSGKRDRGGTGEGRGGGRGARGSASWRDRLAAVQRRRAVLDDLRRSEATRLFEARAKAEARVPNNASVAASVSLRGARRFTTLEGGAGNNSNAAKMNNGNMTININNNKSAPDSASAVQAAVTVQRAFRSTLQYEAWLGDRSDRDYMSQVTLRDSDGKRDEPEPSHHHSSALKRSPSSTGGADSIISRLNTVRSDEWAAHRAKKLHDRHVTIRLKRMVRGFICCTQARYLLLQLLWDRTEGNILGERRSKRAAVESRAASTIQQLSHIRKIAVGLIKIQNSAEAFKLEQQARQAKRYPKTLAKPSGDKHGGRHQGGGGGRVFDTAKQARSEKAECEAILREHGRRGRRLVDTAVRDKFLRDLLYSHRRQHIIRDQREYLMETSRPPLVDSRDVKRMLECPAEEMHMFSDPKNYRTRPRYTRLALPFREIGGIIQDTIASNVRSEYRDKLKEALGTTDARESGIHQQEPCSSPSGAFAEDTNTGWVHKDATVAAAQQPRQQQQAPTVEHAHKNCNKTRASVNFDTGTAATTTPPHQQHAAVGVLATGHKPTPAVLAPQTATAVAAAASRSAVDGRAWRSGRDGAAMAVPTMAAKATAA